MAKRRREKDKVASAPNFWFTSYFDWLQFWKEYGKSDEELTQMIREEIINSDYPDKMKDWLLQVFGVETKKTSEELLDEIVKDTEILDMRHNEAQQRADEAKEQFDSAQKSLQELHGNIETEKMRIQPTLDQYATEEEKEIEAIKTKYRQKREELSKQLRGLERDEQGLQAVINNKRDELGCANKKVNDIGMQREGLDDCINNLYSPTVIIIDASFQPHQLAADDIYAVYYTSEEETRICPNLRNIADHVKPESTDNSNQIRRFQSSKEEGIMVQRIDAIAAIIIRVARETDSDYKVIVSSKMKAALKPFFNQINIEFSRRKKRKEK